MIAPSISDAGSGSIIPASAEEFRSLRDSVARTPEGGAACFVAVLLAYSREQKLGRQCLTLILDRSNVAAGDIYEGYAPAPSIGYHLARLDGQKTWNYLGFAYLQGATPQNKLHCEPAPEQQRQRRERPRQGVCSGGRFSPAPHFALPQRQRLVEGQRVLELLG